MTDRISAKDYISKPKKPSKYRNTPVVVDGIRFDSKREAAYYGELKMRAKAFEVSDVHMQVPFALKGPNGELMTTYKADFVFYDNVQGRQRVIDVKGVETPTFRLKRKMMRALLNIDVEVIR